MFCQIYKQSLLGTYVIIHGIQAISDSHVDTLLDGQIFVLTPKICVIKIISSL
jgi:uridine kinase